MLHGTSEGTSHRPAAALVAILLCLGLPLAPASAQPRASQAEIAEAKEFFQAGKSQQDQGNYGAAAANYKKAYELYPIPILLFNLAQVHRLDGKKHLALDYYQRYLKSEPDGRGSDLARGFVDDLKKALDEQAEAERRRQEEEARQREKELAGLEDGEEGGEGADFEEGAGDSDRSSAGPILKWSGIGTAAVGAVALGFGIKYGIDARNISDELSDVDEQWTPQLLDKQDEGESAETKMFIFTAAGSAAIVGGAVLYYFGYRADRSPEDRLSLVPVAGDGEVGFALSGRF